MTDNGGLTSPPATITIADVTPVNDGPTGTPATITPTEDTPISVPLAGTDPDGTITAITVTQVPPATQGTLVYDNDGNPSTPPIAVPLNTPLTPLQASSVQFVPAPNYNGPVAPVQFTVTDNGGLTSPPATITIADVTPVNDGPVANDDVASTSINTPITNIDVKANDVDPDNTKPELVVSNVIVSPAQGLVTINPDGTINFTPAFNFTGPASITYTITDPSGLSDTATLIVNVGNNNPPDSANFTKSTPEDTPLALGVADFVFTDPDAAQTLTAVRIDSLPTNGALTLNGSPVTAGQIVPIADIAAGNLVFTPDLNENGNNYATFTFSVQDNAGAFDLTPNTATLNVTPVNDAPIATASSITPTEDTPISVPLSGTDIDGTIASFTITAGPTPAQGSLVYDNDGNPATPAIAVPLNTPLTPAQAATVQFVPAANYNGPVAPVTYTVTDNQGLASTPATVTINNVTPVNDAPVDGNEANTVAQNVTLTVPAGTGLLANTTDIDGATPTVTSFTVNSTTVPVTPTTPGSTLIPGVGTITINSDGSYSFAPAANYVGAIPVITYTVNDNAAVNPLTDTSTLTLTMGANNPPVDGNETNTVTEDTTLTVADGAAGDLLNNATDADNNPLSITSFTVNSTTVPVTPTTPGSTLIPGVGTITINSNGSYSFAPVANYTGAIPVITYTVSDGVGGTDTSTLTLSITAVNDAPIAASGSITPTEDTPISVPLSGTDIDGTIASFTITAGPTPAQGSLVYDNDGNPATPAIAVPLNTPLTPAQAATVQFVPAANYNGPVAPVTYTVTDNQGLASTPATVTINNVTPVNDAPVDGNEANTVAQNVTLTVPAGTGLLANTTDIDGATPTVTSFTVNSTTVPVTPTTPGSTLIPGVGTITINSDGSYSFAPAANYVGAIPVITYTVNDNAAVNPLTDTSTLTLTMGANNPPVDGNETNTVTEDTTLTVADGAAGDLLNNATDADNNPLSITSFTVNSTTVPVTPTTPGSTLIPGVGTITINSNGSYSFAPVANYTGAIPVITYTVSDGVGGTDTSTLTLSITAVNDAPIAASGSITPTEDTPISVPLSGTDIDGTIASFTITAGPTPAQGSLVYDNDGNPATPAIAVPLNTPLTPAQAATVQFVPAANYNGPVAPVTYTVTDNQGLASTPATVTINNVTPVNDAPVDGNEANTVAQNVTLTVPAGTGLLANTTDIDGATPTVTSFTVNSTTVPVTPTTPGSTLIPGVGTITINSDGSYSFAPAANYVGAIPVITYTVNDNAAVNPLTDTSTLTLTMGANNPPVDGNETNTVTEDTTLTVADGAAGDLLNNATDADNNPLSITSFTVNSTTVPVTPTTPGSTLIPGVGTITINSNGSYSFAPVANYTGAIPVITYTVSDGVGGTDTSTLTLSITAVNDAPIAASGSITPTEDTPISVPLSGTDIDGTIASFTITAGPTPAQGSLVYDNDGNPATPAIAVPLNTPLTPAQAATVQFVPAANYNGPVAPVTYTVTDNQGLASTPATVTINNVTPVNDAPVDGNEANTVAQNVTLTVPAGTGLLANTTDIDGATPTVTSFTVNSTTVPVTPTTPGSTLIPGVGTITINSDGSYSFAPAANYVGAIPVITYTVNDNAAVNPLTDTSTLTLTMGANNPPVDGNETNTVTEDTTLTVADGAAGDLLNNATDADNNPLSITSFTVNSTTVPVTPTTPGSTLIPGVGTITINSNGSYSFAPVANYTGAIPVITYTVSDGVGGTDTSTLTLSITAVNDAPIAASGSITPTEDTPISVPLSGTDIDGTIASFTITAGPTPAQGSLVYDNDGNPATPAIAVPLNTPLTPAQAATVQFVPAANYNGPVAPVTYTVTDNQGLASTPATVTINNVTPVNDAPVDGNEANTVAQNVTLTVPAGTGLLANTTDIDGATPTVTSFTVNSTTVPVTPTTPGSTLIPGVGTITINSDGSYSFAPAANYVGAIPVITYTVNDNAAVNPLTDTSTLTLTMGANNPPVDGNETNTVTEDTTLTVADGAAGDLLNNATDADNNPLSITSFTVNSTTVPVTPTTPGSTLIPGVGTITINSNGSYSFAPVANYTGAIPVITYTVSDGVGGTDTSTLTLSITAVNDAPIAASGSITPTEDTPISVPLSGTDIDGTIASFTITAGPTPAQGSLVYDNDGNPATPAIAVPLNTPLTPAQAATVQFVPAANYNGPVAPVTYTVTDNQGLASTPATVTINNVTPVNDAPVDGNEANTVAQNVTLTVPAGTGLLANTTDIDGATPTVTSFTVNSTTVPVTPTTPGSTLIPGVGTITINSDGSYSFAPAANYVGAIPVITYTVNDNAAVNPLTDTSTLTLTMGANNPPVDGNETNTVTEDTTLTVADGAAGDLLNNATDADNNPLSITSFTVNSTTVPVTPTTPGSTLIPGVGTITINSNGSYSFAPVANYTGAIPVITYTVSDGVGGTDTSTLTLSITAVNDAPIAASGSITPTEDTPISVPLSGTDIDGTIASFTITAGPTPAQGSLVYDNDGNPATPAIAVPLNTPLTPAQAATVQFVPAANYNGPVAPVTYTVTDNQGLASTPATVTINNVTPVNDAPVDGNEANTVAQNVTLTVPAGTGLLANTTDIDGATPTVTSFTVNSTTVPVTPTTPGSTLIPGVGTITINSDGSYSFAPAANYVGAIPVITYTVNDNAAVNPLTDTSTLTLTMGANNPPVDGNETNTVTEDTTLTVADGAAGDLLNNATDADNNPLSITSFTVNSTTVPVTPTTPGSTLIPGVGTITINSNGSYSFAPVANYTGAIPVITYTVSDGVGGTDTSTLTLSITAVNDAPIAASGSITPTEDTPISVPLSGTDIDGTIASFTITAGPTPAQGSLVYDNDGNPATPAIAVPLNTPLTPAQAATVQFVPAANYNGPVAPVTYTVTDNQGLASTPATVTINNVTPVNDAPVDGNEANTVAQNVTLTVPAGTGLLANTTDIDGATPTVTSFTVNSTTVPVTPTTPGSTLIPGVGTITINSDGSYSFAPAANYVGAIPVITYTVNDNAAVNPLTDTSTLTLTMGANNPPVDGNETNTVTEDTTLTVADGAAGDLLNNATDADNNPLSITSFTVNSTTVPVTPTTPGSTLIPGVGTITINSNGSYSFAPVANYTGAIPVITYTVSDGVGGTDTSTLTLSITAVNDAPIAASGSITPTEDTPISVPLSGTDIDGTIASFTITAGPTPAQGSLVYDNDGNPATPAIAVPLNTPLTPAQAATVQFVPAANYNGPVAPVTYTVTDNQGLASTPATVTINNVTPVNDAPVDGNEANTVAQNVTLTVPAGTGLLANTTDIDGATPTVTSFTVNSTTVPVTPTTPGSTLIPGVGTITINSDGSYSFAPAANYVGAIPVITYTVNDNAAVNPLTDTSTLTLTMGANNPPVDGNETNTVTEDTTLTVADGAAGDLLNNATDADNNPLSITSFTVNSTTVPVTPTTPGSTLIPGVGTITINSNGSYSFAPVANYTGAIPVITYTVSDGVGGTDTSTLTLTINAVNDAPVNTVPGAQTTTEDTARVFSSGNSNVITVADVDGGSLTVTVSVTNGTLSAVAFAGATLSGNGTGTVTISGTATAINGALNGLAYNPTADFNGAATLTLSTDDGITTTNSTVPITVTAVADIASDTVTTNEDTAVAITVLANDSFENAGRTITAIDGNSITAGGAAVAVANGSVTLNASGVLTFTPTANYNGSTSFSYTVTSGGVTETASASVTVVAVNDAPINTVPGSIAVTEDVATSITGISVGDVDAASSTISVTLSVPAGTLAATTGSGVTVSGSGTGSLVLSGTQAAINSFIAASNVSYTTAANANGSVTMTVTTSDGGNTGSGGTLTDVDTVTLNITAVNDAPIAVADTNTAVESGVNPGNTPFAGNPTATGNVLTNDTDVDASDTKTLTVVNATNIAAVGNTTIVGVYGSLSIAADGTYTYTLNNTDTDTQALAQGQVVNEVFNYTMRDTAGLTSSSTLTVAITGTNDRPVLDLDLNNSSGAAGVDYNATYTENSAAIAIVDTDVTVTDVDDTNIESATITLTNPLAGDVLAVGGLPPGITQTIVGNVITLTGTATLSAYQTALRAITYANSSENPATTERVFSIIVNDGSATSAAAVSTILVVAVNDAPVDGDETNVVTEDVTLNVPVGPNSLLANTTDVDGGAARITSFLVAGNAVPFAVAAGSPGVAIIANVGTLTINSDGSYSFAPAANYAGAIPVITYTVSDGAGGTNTSTLTLGMTPVNDAPITVVDTYTVVEGTTASLSTVLANDSDVEGSPLTTVQFATNTSGLNTADADGTNTVTTALGGTVVMNTNGTFTYTAPVRNHGDAIADVDSFAYKASDGTASSAWTTVNINIADTNPIANNDVDSVGIGSTVTGNVITGAGGITADTLNVDAPFNLTSVTLTQGTQVSNNLNTTTNVRTIVTNNGTLAIDLDDGSYSYTAGVTPRVVTNPTGVASFTAQGISLYGFDTANEPYTTANNPASGLNLGSLNATSAGLVRFVDNAAENNDGVGVEQAAGTSNTNRVENTEQLVMGLGVASKSTSIALSDLFAGENVAWDAYDAAGVRVTNGTTTGDADGLVNINISSGTAFSYVVLRSSATSTTTTTPVSNFRVDGATVIPEPTGLPDRFTYTLTDSDGDTSSATLTLNYDSTTTTVNDVATVFESGIDGTLTQNPGTQDGQAIETVRGNVLANDTGVSSFTQITNVNGSTPDANGVITFSDARGTVQIYTQNFGTFVKGDYVVTLTGRTTQGVNDVLTYNYQLQNSVSGQTNTQTLTVNIVDDAPIAENTSTFAALAPVPVYNVFFMIDVSGSMTAAGASGDQRLVDSSGNAIVTTSTAAGGDPVTMTGGTNWGSATLGTSTLAQTRDAVKAVITKYFQESSNVSIELGIFSSGARYDNVSYTTLASALAAVDNLTNVTGGTNYSAGLTALQGMIGAVANPNDGVNRVAYFMTDGVPGSASGTINNAGATITSDTANPANTTGYTTFITNNNIKSYALAVGPAVPNTTALTGVHNADADASDVAGVSNGRDTPIIVTDVVSLTNALINTVPESFSGSIAGSGGISSIQFGADGGYVEYIDLVLDSADAGTVPDTTVRFTFNGTNTITNNNGAIAGGTITGSILTISATQGFTRGSLIFDFKTGEYTFVPQGTVTQGDQITIGFGIIDADGDRAAAVNTITIVNGKPIAQDDYDTLLPSTGLVTDKFFEGNVLNATGTDGGGQEFTGFGNGQDGRDYLIDNADVTSMVFKGFNFNLTAVVANGTAAAGTGGTYGVTAAGELTWTSSTDATNVLVFHRDGYYKYTPPAANVQTLPQDATQNVSFANNATNATTNGVTLGAYSRTANLNNAPDTTVDFNATGAGVATGTANQLDNLENFSIVFNRANHPQGVQNVTININAANSSLGNNGFGSIGALQYSIYDTAGELLGQFASDQEGIITIPSQYSNIGRILIQANSTNTGAGTAGSALIAGVSFNSINISAAAGIPDDTIQYTLTDQNGDTSTATLYMQYITNTFTGVVGNESVTGTSSNDLITETAGGGTLLGLAGNDIIRGGVGGDTIDGGIGDDILEGNGGNDSMIGGLGTDSLYGGDGNDFLNGSDVANSATDLRDDLYGGAGNDTISGGAGNDLIVGGEGNDILTGGIGSDTFRWELSDKGLKGTPATDVINDFDVAPASSGGDVIDLRDLLTGESAGTLANYLHFEKIGNDTIIHISSNGDFATGFNAVKDVQKITLTNADLVQAFTDDQSIINNLIANQKLITD